MEKAFPFTGEALLFLLKDVLLETFGFTKMMNVISLSLCFVLYTGCSKQDDTQPSEKGKIIVLMYHRIVEGEASNLYERSAEAFESDLKYLKDNKIKVLSFNDLEAISLKSEMPEANSAIITFDDGDHSWFTRVKPLLLKYQMKATFFLWTYMIGHDSFITWNEIEDMSHYMLINGDHPFIFGSHSFSHQYLLRNKDNFENPADYNAYLDYEMGKSKEMIETHVPGPVTIFSLPFGDGAGDPEIISAAKRNGYKFIRTSVWGSIGNSKIDLFMIPSLPMLDSTKSEVIGSYLGIQN